MKSVISSRKFNRYTDLLEKHKESGDFAVVENATFLGGEPNKFNPDKNDWIFDIDGVEHVLNSCGHLNWQMEKIGEGDLVTAIYKGQAEIPKGQMKGKMAHQWDVRFERHPENEMEPKVITRKKQEPTEEEIPF